MKKTLLLKIFNIIVYIFAIFGFILIAGYFAVRFHLTNSVGVIDQQNQAFLTPENLTSTKPSVNIDWSKTQEWDSLSQAMSKDVGVVNHVSAITGVDGRLITAQLVAEQLRLFTDEREVFKQVFAPLKILGSQSQFSWGIMGIKEDTAVQIENNLKDPTSPYYLGAQYEHLLDFQTTDIATERFNRLIDEHDHYYDYLYTALFLKEIMAEWKKAGHHISNRPEILSTLYNIGFEHSNPNANPSVGGALITINNQQYSFGGLAYDYYYSTVLTDIFPPKN